MPIKSGRYIITNVKQRNVAFLADSNDGTPIVGCDEQGIPGEQWNVKARTNGHHSILNVDHNRHAVTRLRAASKGTVEGRDDDQQWLIQATNYSGQYTIATIDTGRVWGLEDNWAGTPVKLFALRRDPRIRWTFKRVGPEDAPPNAEVTAAKQLAEVETAKSQAALALRMAEEETSKRKAAEAKVVKLVAQLKIANEETSRARKMAADQEAKRKAEVASKTTEVDAAKREVEMTNRMVEKETARRREAEADVVKKAAELEIVKRQVAQARTVAVRTMAELQATRGEAAVAKVAVAEETSKRKAAEAEVAAKIAEVEKANAEAALAVRIADMETAKRQDETAKRQEAEAEVARRRRAEGTATRRIDVDEYAPVEVSLCLSKFHILSADDPLCALTLAVGAYLHFAHLSSPVSDDIYASSLSCRKCVL